jgi:hypothetical protein
MERYFGVRVMPWLPDFSRIVTTPFWEDTTRLEKTETVF